MVQKRGQDWNRILEDAGLEPPGYAEAAAATDEKTRLRKLAQASRLNKKAKRKRK